LTGASFEDQWFRWSEQKGSESNRVSRSRVICGRPTEVKGHKGLVGDICSRIELDLVVVSFSRAYAVTVRRWCLDFDNCTVIIFSRNTVLRTHETTSEYLIFHQRTHDSADFCPNISALSHIYN